MTLPDPPIRIEYDPFGDRDSRRPSEILRRRRQRRGGRTLRGALGRGVGTLLGLALAVALPFLMLVRFSVLFYERTGLGSWGSVAAAGVASALVLVVYVWLLRVRLQGRWTVPTAVWRGVAVAVVAYLVYALVYLSSAQAKTEDVRRGFLELNPVMRVVASTVLLVDRTALITGAGRTVADYRAWGLPVNEASLHFEQPNGWVHAMDLRTLGRPEWRNRALHLYFWAVGLRTLRHMGTADHLHVSLPVS